MALRTVLVLISELHAHRGGDVRLEDEDTGVYDRLDWSCGFENLSFFFFSVDLYVFRVFSFLVFCCTWWT